MTHSPPADRIYPETKAAAALIVVLLAGGFSLLYLFPNDTERLWAWTISPAMTPLVMGAGYGSGVYFFSRTVAARRWHWVGIGFLPVALFTLLFGLATLLHWDRFHHSHPAFWIWTIAYAVTPILVPVLWLRNRREDPHTPDSDDILISRVIRTVIGVIGAGMLVLACAMFFWPEFAFTISPWKLTPLTARVIAGWIALTGALGIAVWNEPRWSAMRIGLHTAAIGIGLMLLGVPRAWSDFDQSKPTTWIILIGMLGVLIALLVLIVVMDGRRRARRLATQSTPV